MTYVSDFLRESRRIDQLIWDAMSLVAGDRVLFCGYANDGAWIRRALQIGVDVSVIESDEDRLTRLADLRIPTLRGSTTMIPARDGSFDSIVSFHYLHEIDPTFHAQIVSELARVGRRVIVVEPAPPADPLGKRIAELYSRAKFEAGAFEEYQTIDYWRKLLTMVKADVLMQQFTFTRLAPRFAIEETVGLILQAMAIEEMPKGYLDELRELARKPDAQLNPLSRFVLVGVPAGEPVRNSAGTQFRPPDEPAPEVARIAATAAMAASMAKTAQQSASAPAAAAPPAAPAPPSFADHLAGAEFPPVLPPNAPPGPASPPPAAAAPPPAATPFVPPSPAPPPGALPFAPPSTAAPKAEPAFGLPNPDAFGIQPPPGAKPAAPFGTPFALPEDPDPFGLSADPAERAGFGWTWEPPDGGAGVAADDSVPPFGVDPNAPAER